MSWGDQDRPLFGLSQRQPPANLQAEQALLGALLANNRAADRVADFLKPEHFADPIHGRIYSAILARVMAGRIADAVTMRAEFEHSGILDDVGGVAYLAQLLSAMVGIINAGEYGRAILDAWMRRQLIDLGETLVNAAFGGTNERGEVEPAEQLATAAFVGLDGILSGTQAGGTLIPFDAALDAAMAAADRAAEQGGVTGLSTGMASIDEAMGGMHDGDLIILAGRPGMGKSSLGMGWAISVARACRDETPPGQKPTRGVFVGSLEMRAAAIGTRALAESSNLATLLLRRGKHLPYRDQLEMARAELDGMPLLIDDTAGLTMGQIRIRCRKAARQLGRLALIVIDHLHIVSTEDADQRRGETWATGQVSRSAKRLAKEFGCPVLGLAQLSRGVESREDKRPQLADLRQSGAFEEDADVVAFIYRAEYYLKKEAPEKRSGETPQQYDARCLAHREELANSVGKADVIFAKLREGPQCTKHLRWHAETTSFADNTATTDELYP
jgi:replicative DNA helicase